MKFLYATDLHGNTDKFETVLDYSITHSINLIHLGADILPKGKDLLSIQEKFVNGYLRGFFHKCQENGIRVLTMFGNDDLYSLKDAFRTYSPLLDEEPVILNDTVFAGYPYVPDYPFGLVTACKYDHADWTPEYYSGPKFDFINGELRAIKDKKAYFKNKGTIEDDLSKMSVSHNTVMAFHCPPQSLGLDVCYKKKSFDVDVFLGIKKASKPSKKKVGSKSILDWITREQPRLVLCGHIHESPEITGKWMGKIGNTVVIQPGQDYENTTIVVISLGEEDSYERVIL